MSLEDTSGPPQPLLGQRSAVLSHTLPIFISLSLSEKWGKHNLSKQTNKNRNPARLDAHNLKAKGSSYTEDLP